MKSDEKKAKIIGSRIRAAREELGYPQLRLAHELNFESATAISLIESGERNITAENLERLARFLNKDVHYFLGTRASKTTDVVTALRADPDLVEEDRQAILHLIEMAKKRRYGARRDG